MKANQFQRHLAQLKGWRETAFILALAERAYPNFALFSQVVEFSGAQAVTNCLEQGWAALVENAEEDRYIELLELLEENVPDLAEYDMFGAVTAVSFCETLEQALLSQVNTEKRRATDTAQNSFEGVMDFIETTEGEGLSEDELVKVFDQSSLIKREMAFQEELVDRLRKESVPDQHVVAGLRLLASDEGVSNIGISLDEE
ncbi:YjaG family protein [Alkalimarinus alittae]|uniref:YjaG family protein n=1 Tax=Alkalimarinus alittae TaxID=2961619 RepID=A0ABY6N5J2_9ALTE|nr:YjaG family protein [Alkalimarinus alittae]UZE97392.1 YjaG family protein [Alkalimarinus alittae]